MRRTVPDVIHSTMGQANPGHLTEGKFYKFQRDPEWVPNDPRYREPETARRPGPPPGSVNSPEAKAERFARFCAARAEDKSLTAAAIAAGVAIKTARKYEAERRQQREESRDD